jgi:hypothetical protein
MLHKEGTLPTGIRVALVLLAVSAATPMARAGAIPLLDITGGQASPVTEGGNATEGFAFDVLSSTVISGLGIFDVGSNGLINAHQVGLWTSTGTLLASATVTGSASVVASASSLGDWLETSITPLTLTPGSYVLGAYFLDIDNSSEDRGVLFATASPIAGITYTDWMYGSSPTFGFPVADAGGSASSAGLFGPMAFVSDDNSTPEPGTFSLGLFVVLFCGVAFRWNRRAGSRN